MGGIICFRYESKTKLSPFCDDILFSVLAQTLNSIKREDIISIGLMAYKFYLDKNLRIVT